MRAAARLTAETAKRCSAIAERVGQDPHALWKLGLFVPKSMFAHQDAGLFSDPQKCCSRQLRLDLASQHSNANSLGAEEFNSFLDRPILQQGPCCFCCT